MNLTRVVVHTYCFNFSERKEVTTLAVKGPHIYIAMKYRKQLQARKRKRGEEYKVMDD